MEAKDFAQRKLDEGLTVFAGTINPHLPRQVIPSGNIPCWLKGQELGGAKPNDGGNEEESERTQKRWHLIV